MNDRIKVFGIIALVGFMAGVVAQVAATYFIPWMIAVLPSLAGLTSYMVTGMAGAVLTVALVGVWAHLTNRNQ